MGTRRNWTPEEDELLEANWGRVSLSELARIIGRAETGILIRSKRIGLGPSKDGQGMMNANQLATTLRIDRHCVTDYWIEKCALPATRQITKKVYAFWMIDLSDFWTWAEQNQDKFDSRRFAPLALGPEPDWMGAKREADELLPKRRLQIWTPEEDDRLIKLIRSGMTQERIGEIMGRSHNSVERRAARLRKRGLL